MKRMFSILLVFLFTAVCLNAQYFQKERLWVGPTLGYGFFSLGLGAQGEYGLTENIGLGMDIGYMSSTEDIGMGFGGSQLQWEYTFLGILFSGSYHFTPNEKFDPFVKLGLGYFNIDSKLSDEKFSSAYSSAWASGVGYGAQIGARYHFNDQWSGRASIGYPFYFAAGVDIAFGGHKASAKKRDMESKPVYKDDEVVTDDEDIETTNENPVTERVKRDRYHMYVGPYIGMNGCLNTAIGNGYYPKPGFSGPDAGVSIILPFGKKTSVGAMLDIGYSRNSFTTYPSEKDNDSNTVTETYSYINIQPSLYLGGFTLGLVFGFPSDLTAEDQRGKEVSVIKGISAIPSELRGYVAKEPTEFLTTRVDVRLGGTIHVLNDENGMLNINIHAAYNLSGLYQHAEDYEYAYEKDPESGQINPEAKSKLNATPVSLTFGISYLFNIGF